MDITDKHAKFLEEHCRVCGSRHINPSSDDSAIHPKFFCNSCYLTAKTASMKLHPGETINKDKFDWLPHDDDECTICTAGRGRGRPKKKSFGGRPSALVQHIRAVSCPLPATEIHVLDTQYKEDVCCIVCKSVAIKAVEIQPCKLRACQSCCIQLVSQKQPAFTCPGCSLSHDCADITFSSVSPFVKKIIGNLLVHIKLRITTCGIGFSDSKLYLRHITSACCQPTLPWNLLPSINLTPPRSTIFSLPNYCPKMMGKIFKSNFCSLKLRELLHSSLHRCSLMEYAREVLKVSSCSSKHSKTD